MTQATTWSVPLVGPATPTVMAQRTDDSFDALLSGHSGSARPTYAVAGTIWEDTSVAGKTRIYFYDGSTDILLTAVDTVNDRVEYAPQPFVDVASAATTDIGAATSKHVRVTGTTTITSFGTASAGTVRRVKFAGVLTLTYNSTSLILYSPSNVTTYAGLVMEFVSEGSGNWRETSQTTNLWEPIEKVTVTGVTSYSKANLSAFRELRIRFRGKNTATASVFNIQVSEDNGSTWVQGASDYQVQLLYGTGTSTGTSVVSDTSLGLTSGNTVNIAANSWGIKSTTELSEFNQAASTAISSLNGYHLAASGFVNNKLEGLVNRQIAANAIRLASGQAFSGTITLEGIRG